MNLFTIISLSLLTTLFARGSFRELTTEDRVAQAQVIAIIKVTETHYSPKRFSNALVLTALLGVQEQETIKIERDTFIDEDGHEMIIAGRDAYLQKGHTYLIYLKKNKKGKYVTVSSSHDCIPIVKRSIRKTNVRGSEPIENRIELIKRWIKIKKIAEQKIIQNKPK